jgi:phage terminase Nu1 subunit (DNA packaging protein)
MSKNLKLSERTATAAELATLFGVSARTVREHANAGVVVRAAEKGQYKLKPSVQNYAALLRKRVAQKKEDPLEESRAKLLHAKADIAERQLKTFVDRHVDRGECELQWQSMVRAMRAGLGALPARIARRLPHLDSHAIGVLESEVRDALAVIADEPEGTSKHA